jgi:hypothetical protein
MIPGTSLLHSIPTPRAQTYLPLSTTNASISQAPANIKIETHQTQLFLENPVISTTQPLLRTQFLQQHLRIPDLHLHTEMGSKPSKPKSLDMARDLWQCGSSIDGGDVSSA